MSLLKADTIKPVTSSGDLSLQGDSGGSAVDCLNITSAGDINFTGNTDAKIKLPSAGGIYESDGSTAVLTESGGAVTLDNVALGGSVTGAGGLYVSIAIICDQKAKDENGGTFTYNEWQRRDLQTEISDADGIVSISAHQFTLAAGTYHVEWSAPANGVDAHASRLYNITDTSQVQVSQTGNATAAASDVEQWSIGTCVFTIAGSKAFEIQHRCQTTQASNGFGINANLIYPTLTAPVSIYTVVTIRKQG